MKTYYPGETILLDGAHYQFLKTAQDENYCLFTRDFSSAHEAKAQELISPYFYTSFLDRVYYKIPNSLLFSPPTCNREAISLLEEEE